MGKKVAFFDMDGTLAAPQFYTSEDVCGGFPDAVWKQFCQEKGEMTYADCVPIFEAFQYAKDLKSRGWDCVILSVSSSDSETKAKEYWIQENNPDHVFTRIYCVSSDDEKFELIKNYAKKHEIDLKDCMIVEDNYYNVLKGIEIGIRAMHISHIFTQCYNAARFPFTSKSKVQQSMTLRDWWEINKSIVKIVEASVEIRRQGKSVDNRIAKVESMKMDDIVGLFGSLEMSRVDATLITRSGYGSTSGFEIVLIKR